MNRALLLQAKRLEQTQLLKEKYSKFIENAFDLVIQDLTREEKAMILKGDYSSLVSSDIIKNELFLNLLFEVKGDIQKNNHRSLTQHFNEVLLHLFEAKIIDDSDFSTLKIPVLMEPPKLVHSIPVQLQMPLQNSIKKVEAVISANHSPLKLKVMTLKDFQIESDCSQLEEIFHLIKVQLETERTLKEKMNTIEVISDLFNQIDFTEFEPECQAKLCYYGSMINQFSIFGSDIDVSIDTGEYEPREVLNFFVKKIKRGLSSYPHKIERLLFERVRIPLVDITFEDWNTTISFSVNNKLGVINSKLLELYSCLDVRCKLLGIIIKVWSKMNKINSAKNQFLSSYAYNLMVIYFLQRQDPPILPSLQKLKEDDVLSKPQIIKVEAALPKGEKKQSFETRIDYEDDMEKLKQIMIQNYSNNKKSVLTLLEEFFEFYLEKNNFEERTLSIRRAKPLIPASDVEYDYLYSLEDPFDKMHNPGKHVKVGSENAKKMSEVMFKSSTLLKQQRVKDIFYIK